MVNEYVPAATPEVVLIVKLVVFGVLLFAPATLSGVKVAEAPVGNPVVVNVTLHVVLFPVKPTVTGLNVVELPATTGLGDWAATVTVPIFESVNFACAVQPDIFPAAVAINAILRSPESVWNASKLN